MPACSPACTRLQYRLSKYSGNLRNAAASAEPVSTSVLMSMSSFPTAGLEAPLLTISNDCSSGTPAFIIVASWRVKSAMSFEPTDPPPLRLTGLTFCTRMPWRRSVALTAASLTARNSPRMTLPALSLPSQLKVSSFGPFAAATAVAILAPFLLSGNDPYNRGMMPVGSSFVKAEVSVLSL